MKINEGLQQHDLDFTIMPLVSIDEYESKIDDRKAIVIGFYVTENDPATDLAAFIEKGIIKVLDTDVSPAPTEDGHYLVFVELDRNDKFPENLLKIIEEISNVTNIEEWEFSPLHSKQDENYPLIEGNIITLSQQGIERKYKVIEFDYDEPSVPIMFGNIGDSKLFESNRLQYMLGHNYSVYSSGTHLLAADDTSYMLLTPID